ncbi:hypothetical protein BUALT_Bualt02G0218600 [Buddleja alternifolia]|uniref:Uncharacterized protein n=1 Tax=Buddleja alternifolia TaxID=168488 RepID=A0AAV6YD11_9LAMI|nr:hypothetical protein BUALT_Bualt02G0218600 [Buddleja alternifolia]
MKDFPSCFGENGVQVSDSSSSSSTNKSAAQNLVTFIYRYQSQSFSGFITVTWIKYLMGQGLSIEIENSTKESLCKFDVKAWLFSKRKGFKNLVVKSTTIDIHWDLSSAKFGPGPEPLEGFYLAIALNQESSLFLGDLENEFYKKMDLSSIPFVSRAILVAKRENIFGKRFYSSKAQFCDMGKLHDIRIECDKSLVIYIDNKMVLQVMNLKWNFRGNQIILVDGISIELYWDVYSWLFGSFTDNAIFLFRSRVPGAKAWANRSPADASALSWPVLQGSKDSYSQAHGFSLVLCAWKNE